MFFAEIFPYELIFNKPAKTSRNTLLTKPLHLLRLSRRNSALHYGLGEISPFEGLSIDDGPGFLPKLAEVVAYINEGRNPADLDLQDFPSIRFGLETALLDLENGGEKIIFRNAFSEGKAGIPINGLIWMSDTADMLRQVEEKIVRGFTCIKLKVGALDFDEECRLLESIRKTYPAFRLELRVDANGAFPVSDALGMLKDLHRFELHSIEQPIRQGQWDMMQELCAKSPLPIALDEELLGISPGENGEKLLKTIRPAYGIIKPGLLGGFRVSREWTDLLHSQNTGWWITSALESNIGLNAIAQFTGNYDIQMPQGLGTGLLYTNNISSPLQIENDRLFYRGSKGWELQEALPGKNS